MQLPQLEANYQSQPQIQGQVQPQQAWSLTSQLSLMPTYSAFGQAPLPANSDGSSDLLADFGIDITDPQFGNQLEIPLDSSLFPP